MSTSTPASMLAFRVRTPGDPEGEVQTIPVPYPLPDEALVRVLRAGVCNTDLEIMKGYMGFTGVLGHEFVGVVELLHPSCSAADHQRLVGQRVVGDINLSCGTCDVCDLRNDCSRNHCPKRSVLGIMGKDGTFSEYLTLPVVNLHLVPPGVSDEQAVFVEPLAAACRIVEQGLARNDDGSFGAIAILGDGKLGLMITEVLGREHGRWSSTRASSSNPVSPPILFGKHEHKMAFVEGSGADCRNVSELYVDGTKTAVAAKYVGKFDVVVDATGSPAGLSLAAKLCRPMGTLVLKSTCADGEAFNAAPFVINELRVVGSRCGPFPAALELLAIPDDDDERVTGTATRRSAAATWSPCCGLFGVAALLFLVSRQPTKSLSGVAVASLGLVAGGALAGLAGNLAAEATDTPLRVEKYVTRTFPLAEAKEAIKCAKERGAMKVQIICSQ